MQTECRCLRLDQLLNLAWKFLVPLALVNLIVAAAWHYTSGWGAILVPVRWALCAAVFALPFVLLGRALNVKKLPMRKYHYAE